MSDARRKQAAEQAALDQKMTQLTDMMPTVWYGLYRNCVSAGFSADDAMSLVRAFVMASNGVSIQLPPGSTDLPDFER